MCMQNAKILNLSAKPFFPAKVQIFLNSEKHKFYETCNQINKENTCILHSLLLNVEYPGYLKFLSFSILCRIIKPFLSQLAISKKN